MSPFEDPEGTGVASKTLSGGEERATETEVEYTRSHVFRNKLLLLVQFFDVVFHRWDLFALAVEALAHFFQFSRNAVRAFFPAVDLDRLVFESLFDRRPRDGV